MLRSGLERYQRGLIRRITWVRIPPPLRGSGYHISPVMDYETKHSPINQISPFGEIPKQKLGRTLDDSATRYSPLHCYKWVYPFLYSLPF